MNLDLSCVESFVVLAGEQSFSKAAARLNMTQSALSKRISRLERDLGARLAERDAGGFIDLTPKGIRFLPHCESLLRNARGARLAMLADGPSSTVRLGVPGSPADHFPSAAWQALVIAVSKTAPGYQVRPVNVPFGRLEDSLLTRRVDVLVSNGEFDHPALHPTALFPLKRVLLLPAAHPLCGVPSVSADLLAGLPMVREPTASPRWMSQWLPGELRDQHDSRVVDVHAQTLAGILKAVAEGGATTLAASTLKAVPTPGIVARPVTGLPPITIYAVRRRHDERDGVLALISVLQVLAVTLAFAPDRNRPGELP